MDFIFSFAGILLPLIFIGVVVFMSATVVEQQTVGLVERFGQFNRTLTSGLNFIIPFIETVKVQNMRVMQIPVPVETKTKDNVFIKTTITVQFFVIPEKVYESFYKLQNPATQISAYIFDSVRSVVPKMTLDDFFDKKDEIADVIKKELSETMDKFGYQIERALVTDIEPDAKVKESMNQINAAERLKKANEQMGEANKILVVKNAEADAEAKRQQGLGIAQQRMEILKGFQEAISSFKTEHGDVSTDEIMKLMLMTQYLDALKSIGSENSVLMVPHGPGHLASISEEMIMALKMNDMSVKKDK